jgi:hypothetical protein
MPRTLRKAKQNTCFVFFVTWCRVRATSANFAGKRREESRRGTQECVRHNEISNLAEACATR